MRGKFIGHGAGADLGLPILGLSRKIPECRTTSQVGILMNSLDFATPWPGSSPKIEASHRALRGRNRVDREAGYPSIGACGQPTPASNGQESSDPIALALGSSEESFGPEVRTDRIRDSCALPFPQFSIRYPPVSRWQVGSPLRSAPHHRRSSTTHCRCRSAWIQRGPG